MVPTDMLQLGTLPHAFSFQRSVAGKRLASEEKYRVKRPSLALHHPRNRAGEHGFAGCSQKHELGLAGDVTPVEPATYTPRAYQQNEFRHRPVTCRCNPVLSQAARAALARSPLAQDPDTPARIAMRGKSQ